MAWFITHDGKALNADHVVEIVPSDDPFHKRTEINATTIHGKTHLIEFAPDNAVAIRRIRDMVEKASTTTTVHHHLRPEAK